METQNNIFIKITEIRHYLFDLLSAHLVVNGNVSGLNLKNDGQD